MGIKHYHRFIKYLGIETVEYFADEEKRAEQDSQHLLALRVLHHQLHRLLIAAE